MIQQPERICRYCRYWHQRYPQDTAGECRYVLDLNEHSLAWIEDDMGHLRTACNFSCAAWQQWESDHDSAA